MGTPLGEVYELFMHLVNDYRLQDLVEFSPEDFETYLEPWLIFAIAEFSGICDQPLTYDKTTKTFDNELSLENKVILAKLMLKYWYEKVINDITQMNLHVEGRGFNISSEALYLREKKEYLNAIKEECSQMLTDYSHKRIDWGSWYSQMFS